jgi:hypothetical protein
MLLVLILGVGLFYVYAEDAAKNASVQNKTTDKEDIGSVPVTIFERDDREDNAVQEDREVSSYKPATKKAAITADVSRLRPTDSAITDLSQEEEAKQAK